MIQITRRLEWDAAHRVLGHEGKCRHLHGHRYVAEITITSVDLDSVGRVIDFGVVKEKVGGWVDAYWDHNILLHQEDPLSELWRCTRRTTGNLVELAERVFGGKIPFVMSYGNPTAENIAKELYEVSKYLLTSYPITVTRVRIYETPNSFADYEP